MITKTTKTRWLNALRSDKYTKGNGNMHKNGKYTAIGALCAATGNTKNRSMNNVFPRIDKDGTVLEFMGLSPSIQHRIKLMNDRNRDFTQVIRYISRNIKVKN